MTDQTPSSKISSDAIIDVALDTKHIISVSPAVEREREQAIRDLRHDGMMTLNSDLKGPYKLRLAIAEGYRLSLNIEGNLDGKQPEQVEILVALMPVKTVIRDYLRICENYYTALKNQSPATIEPIDMARRGIHNEGSDMLRDLLRPHMTVDKNTVRRFFSLITALHIHG